MNILQGGTFFCSWSGGKDCCLALYRTIQQGGKPTCLLTILREDGERSHSHGLLVSVLQQQAKALSIPLVTRNASWANYTAVFTNTLQQFKEQGIEYGVFGNIDIDEHRQWGEEVCSATGISACHPLWQIDRETLLNEFLRLEFKAKIIAIKQNDLGKDFLGKQLCLDTIRQMKIAGIDVCGENGEYHTVVTGGPLFSLEINLLIKDREYRDGYYFLSVS